MRFFFAPVHDREMTEMNRETNDPTIRQIEFELEQAERGMSMPYDAERVMELRSILRRRASRNCPRG